MQLKSGVWVVILISFFIFVKPAWGEIERIGDAITLSFLETQSQSTKFQWYHFERRRQSSSGLQTELFIDGSLQRSNGLLNSSVSDDLVVMCNVIFTENEETEYIQHRNGDSVVRDGPGPITPRASFQQNRINRYFDSYYDLLLVYISSSESPFDYIRSLEGLPGSIYSVSGNADVVLPLSGWNDISSFDFLLQGEALIAQAIFQPVFPPALNTPESTCLNSPLPLMERARFANRYLLPTSFIVPETPSTIENYYAENLQGWIHVQHLYTGSTKSVWNNGQGCILTIEYWEIDGETTVTISIERQIVQENIQSIVTPNGSTVIAASVTDRVSRVDDFPGNVDVALDTLMQQHYRVADGWLQTIKYTYATESTEFAFVALVNEETTKYVFLQTHPASQIEDPRTIFEIYTRETCGSAVSL